MTASYAVVDFNGWDDVVEHVWVFSTRELANAFTDKHWGRYLPILEVEDSSDWNGE